MRHILLVALIYFSINTVRAQQQFTPYDDLPCIQSGIKPTYSNRLPDWGKLLYQYPVNYKTILAARDTATIVKSPIERYFKVWNRCVQTYVRPDGMVDIPKTDAVMKYLQKMQYRKAPVSSRTENSWQFVGPKETFWLNEAGSGNPPAPCPWQSNIYSFDVAPTNKDILYAGSETGFLSKSVNNGESWMFMARHYNFGGGITAIAIHPQDANTLYVAAGNQIHKSTDGGNTFVPMLTGEYFNADRLRIDANNPSNLYAASSEGVFISKDAGITWQKTYNNRAWDVRIHPANPSRMYAVVSEGDLYNVIISNDGGETFSLANFPTNYFSDSGAMLAVTPDNPNLVLVILLGIDNTPHLLKGLWNSNGTLEWNLLVSGRSSQLEMDNGQGYFDLVLEISPVDQNVIFVGTTTLYKSTSAGLFFTPVGGYQGDFQIHPDIQDMKILDDGTMWVATDGGMNYSSDYFSSIDNYRVSVKGLMGSDFWGFDQGWNEDVIVGGRYHNGNTSIADFYGDKALRMGGAESPTGWVLKGRKRHVVFDDLGNGFILPKTAEGKLEGRFIFSKHPNMDEFGGRRSNLVQHPNYFGTMMMGEGNSLWQTTDFGVNWVMLQNFERRVRYLQISPSNPDVLYVDVVDLGLFKSEDGGKTFERKPALTEEVIRNSYWGGKLNFDISPSDPNTIYACQQNGTWSKDLGAIYLSKDGGDTWVDWSAGVNAYLKSVLVQPGDNGEDIVYLFTIGGNSLVSKVYYRKASMNNWVEMDEEYPVGMRVNLPKLFYRDSKIRVSGTNGVWEYPMLEKDYPPIIRPAVEKAVYSCYEDTVLFNDLSIIDHEGVSWEWRITPEPTWMENKNSRNPKVILGKEGFYDVELIVKKGTQTYSKKIEQMVYAQVCPSLENCSNPAMIPKENWSLVYVDSEEQNFPGLATMAFDGDASTIWHTRWSTGSDPYPHEIQIDLGDTYKLSDFTYIARQDGFNGRIKDFELYLSEDLEDWNEAVADSTFENTAAPQNVRFDSLIQARYLRLVALSEVNGNAWSSAAEFDMKGCFANTTFTDDLNIEKLNAFPVPSNGIFYIDRPPATIEKLTVYNMQGQVVSNSIQGTKKQLTIDIQNVPAGIYYVKIATKDKLYYHVKLIKN